MSLSTLSRNLDKIESYLDKQESVLSAVTPAWFKNLSKEEQRDYFKEHPGSRFKPGAGNKKAGTDTPNSVNKNNTKLDRQDGLRDEVYKKR